ncbi:MAG: serine/threonine protein kinase [Gemmatimonadales bacterium]|nr:MAG: serine/threonine protein kinase [Gemmatimonadales bacterium]
MRHMVPRMSGTPDLEFLALQQALLGRYSLEREIGRGGMGIVYLAHEVRLDRPVALKLLPPEYASQPPLRERFLREARTAAKLSQPNIVPIYSVDEVDGFVFFVMMYVEGETLGQRVRARGPLPASEAIRILREVAWALAYAHGQGVVHRDVKPDNILIEAGSGRALVTDFGIAQVGDGAGLTATGEVLGTAEYMSPEQARGEAVDKRSDLYSLGVLGHYMLSGQLPFQGTTVAATLAKHITQEAPPLAGVAPGLPRQLTQAVDRCLAKDPAGRFADGEQLADALSRALEVRQEVPFAIRMFTEQNQKSSTAIVTISLGAVWLTIFDFAGGIIGLDFAGIAFMTVLTVAVAATPPLILTHTARRLLRSGYGYDDLIRALRGDIELRRDDLASQHGRPAWIDRWARKLTYGGAALFMGWVGLIPFVPDTILDLIVLAIVLPGSVALIGAGLVGGLRHQIRSTVPGEHWFKFWKSRVGRWLFKLAGVRLDRVEAGGAAHRPTETAIGMAADRLYEDLPKDVRNSFKELPDVVGRLERDAEMMRARIKELDRVLSSIESDEAMGWSGTAAAAPGVSDKRASLTAEVQAARGAAEKRLSEAVAALETIRLELLRLHAGAGSVESMTADLKSALELSEDIGRVLEGGREVEKLLGAIDDPSKGAS